MPTSVSQKGFSLTNYIVPFSRIGTYCFGALSALVLMGWIFHIAIFKSILPGFLPMNPTEALCFILASIALTLRIEQKEISTTRIITIDILSLIIFFVGLLTSVSIFLHLPFRPDALLFSQQLGNSFMSPNSAINFIFLGIALFAFNKQITTTFKLTQFFTLLVGVITMFAGIGYAYNVLSFYKISLFSAMPLNSACAFTLLCVCLLLSTHDYGMMTILTDKLTINSLSRRLLVIAMSYLFFLG